MYSRAAAFGSRDHAPLSPVPPRMIPELRGCMLKPPTPGGAPGAFPDTA